MSEIGTKVTAIFNKLPTNYIMGSSVQTDKDDEIDAILVDTDEIQGKLPDDYIMGSSVTSSMDDEINAIIANTGKVVYGSVAGTGGIPRAIQAGSVAGFVEDEKL